jgi:hypothetical protein
MDSEIKKLQNRIIELEKEKKEKEELDKLSKNDIDFNFNILNEILNSKKNGAHVGFETKEMREELIERLEAIFNILNMLNSRVSKLEGI